MKNLLLGKALVVLVVLTLISPLTARAAPLEEPTPEGSFRVLRPNPHNYIQTWHIYNDSSTDGILNPGDQQVNTFQNWWTPASSHSQHNYSVDGGGFTFDPDSDINSSPINYASHNNSGKEDFWLDETKRKNTLQFYMTYSQFDNNDFKGGYTGGMTGDQLAIVSQRHEERNGWALGWLSHSQEDGPVNPQTYAGFVEMDILVHDGRGLAGTGEVNVPGWGTSYSNPQVSVSNDICSKAIDGVGANPAHKRYHPPQFDDDPTKGYSWATNATRMLANGYNAADLNDIVNSMEVEEYDPYSMGPADAIWDNRTPSIIKATLTDHLGNPYTYDDAVLNDSFYHDGASDGGVIAGLAGQTNYDLQVNNWGDQQVIRIDISQETLMSGDPSTCGNITQIIIWDFGASTPGATGTQQTAPTAIVFGVDLAQTVAHGQIYWDDGTGGRIYFPENRIYIAQVNIIPEPACLTLLAMGAGAMLLRRRRRTAM